MQIDNTSLWIYVTFNTFNKANNLQVPIVCKILVDILQAMLLFSSKLKGLTKFSKQRSRPYLCVNAIMILDKSVNFSNLIFSFVKYV